MADNEGKLSEALNNVEELKLKNLQMEKDYDSALENIEAEKKTLLNEI